MKVENFSFSFLFSLFSICIFKRGQNSAKKEENFFIYNLIKTQQPKQTFCQSQSCWALINHRPAKDSKIAFSDSFLVAHAKIISSEPAGFLTARYKVEYTRIYKSPVELNGTLPNEIEAATEESLCGLVFIPGGDGLIIGRYDNGRMTTSHCNYIRGEENVEQIIEHKIFESCEEINKCPENFNSKWRQSDSNYSQIEGFKCDGAKQ